MRVLSERERTIVRVECVAARGASLRDSGRSGCLLPSGEGQKV